MTDTTLFNQQGYLIFPEVITPEWCKLLRAEADTKEARLPVYLPEHSALISYDWFLSVTKKLMRGEKFAFHHMHSACHDPGMPDFPWHHDYEQYPQVNRDHTMIHFFIYLNGLNGTIGDLVVVPGTHMHVMGRYDYTGHGAGQMQGEVVINDLPEGSIVAIHSGLLHCRRAQPGGIEPRYLVDTSYCQHGTTWPAYKERGNWREILGHLRAKEPHVAWMFDEECFYE